MNLHNGFTPRLPYYPIHIQQVYSSTATFDKCKMLPTVNNWNHASGLDCAGVCLDSLISYMRRVFNSLIYIQILKECWIVLNQ